MENVNHPSHYKREGKKECIVEMEEAFGTESVITFCLLNAYKYMYRAGLKEGNAEEQDKQKALWYCEYAAKLRNKLLDKNE
jgi:hypothetical protein